ncbi:hypothetical protein [Arcobacter porcinus]|uniref:Uncharacterized protein n=1 Tax=Arcobacter porcinus TaxID=1935204 RepID=A0A5C2HB10_9BACT|nr:hypothetical protein [Arcobacter porcinus]OCL89557.1 hypothetical protein AAX27_01832 [Aliarcobacter thereius]QEP39989.1 hypothetical protein APORC_0359 [Arcobacter porcinus]
MAENKTKTENNIENSDNLNDADTQTTHKTSDKQTLIKKILIVAIALLTIFLILIIILLSNKSSNEEIIDNSSNIAKAEEQTIENINEEEQDFKFDFKKLDPDKLNEQLELLTNKSLEQKTIEEIKDINNPDKKRTDASDIFLDNDKLNNIEENQNIINNENIIAKNENIDLDNNNNNQDEQENKSLSNNKEKENSLKEENKNPTITVNNGLILILNKNDEKIKKDSEAEENIEFKENNKTKINLVNLINVAKIKGNLKKSYYDKINQIDSSLLLCRDNQDNIEIYFGPFTNNNLQKELLSKLLNAGFTESYSLEMSEEEFNKRCKY